MKSQPVVSLFLKDRFWAWILVSRTLIIFSSAILAMGLLSIPIGYIHIHAILMLLGVRLFYYGIMWAQIPSYTGYIPLVPRWTLMVIDINLFWIVLLLDPQGF